MRVRVRVRVRVRSGLGLGLAERAILAESAPRLETRPLRLSAPLGGCLVIVRVRIRVRARIGIRVPRSESRPDG